MLMLVLVKIFQATTTHEAPFDIKQILYKGFGDLKRMLLN